MKPLSQILLEARLALAQSDEQSGWPLAFRAWFGLDTAAGSQLGAVLDFLDAMTPGSWPFSLWLDGARDAVSDGDWVGVTYHYDRTKPELLAAFGKAAQRAFRAEQEAA